MRLLVVGLLALAMACGDSGDGGQGFDGCGDVASNCAPTTSCSETSCPFDSSEVDCELACQNVLAVCDGGCPEANCAGLVNMETCLQTCGLERDSSCGNATFGCYAVNNRCENITRCLGCSP